MRLATGVLIVLAFSTLRADAEELPMKPEHLTAGATHVITGKVHMIYERTRQYADHKIVRYVAEIVVKTVEKGEGLKAGDAAHVRYWTRVWTGPGNPTPDCSGHGPLPREGETIRVHLRRDARPTSPNALAQALEVLRPNGFQRLSESR